jgi:hypothetical protein
LQFQSAHIFGTRRMLAIVHQEIAGEPEKCWVSW